MSSPCETRTVEPARRLCGDLRVPADKSLSHRAALLAALAEGESRIRGFLAAEDCLATLSAVQALGAKVTGEPTGELRIRGGGLGGLREPTDVLDAGNSGTTLRLLAGVAAGLPGLTVLTGDASLRRRPMGRVVDPLVRMGARILGRGGGALAPLAIGGGGLRPIAHASPVASAQVKSAVLLAGLFAEGETSVSEPHPSRDHTERMLAALGATVRKGEGGVSVLGRPTLRPFEFDVPGDVSSAAFWVVAATIVPGSEVVLRGVGVNETRTGALDVLLAMGADIRRVEPRLVAGEPVCDLVVRGAPLRGTRVEAHQAPRLIDEVPILAVAAACAEGDTLFEGVGELRHKESDRLAAIIERLGALGLRAVAEGECLRVHGGACWQAGEVDSGGDHRMAMSAAVVGLLARGTVTVRDTACVRTSYPGFWDDMRRLVGG
ncbi:MAG: 3-phosphoshikimate 1-carboxyvinyltransferase [Candidatus Sericytochromatia bacterium]|nr:3-phosphoshikimate 1-carboxyvinyltransferase [Candidatus Sericytochromatia bacterium]